MRLDRHARPGFGGPLHPRRQGLAGFASVAGAGCSTLAGGTPVSAACAPPRSLVEIRALLWPLHPQPSSCELHSGLRGQRYLLGRSQSGLASVAPASTASLRTRFRPFTTSSAFSPEGGSASPWSPGFRSTAVADGLPSPGNHLATTEAAAKRFGMFSGVSVRSLPQAAARHSSSPSDRIPGSRHGGFPKAPALHANPASS